MAGENQGGQNQDNFLEYGTNTLAEVYTTVPESLIGSGLGFAGLVNALIKGGEHKILTPRVKPLPGLEPNEQDYNGERFNPYIFFGGWLGSKTEYEWKPVTLRGKKEGKPTTPQLHPYKPYGYPYKPYGSPYTPYKPYGYPYRSYSQTSTNQSQSGDSITLNPIPNQTYVPDWIKSIDEWLNKGA